MLSISFCFHGDDITHKIHIAKSKYEIRIECKIIKISHVIII